MQNKYPNNETLRFLCLGNSHTIGATHLLYEVFQKEMPEQKVEIGNMYYSGCSVLAHLEFAEEKSPVYWYCKNTDGTWNIQKDAPLTAPFEDRQWDVVMLHEMNNNVVHEQTYTDNNIQKLRDYVLQQNKKLPAFYWNFSWANPTCDELLPDSEFINGWKEGYKKHSDFNYGIMAANMIKMTQKYVKDKYLWEGIAPTGTAFYYARNILGQHDTVLYKDYTHATDFGRLIASYVWFGTLTGKTHFTKIKVDRIPARLRDLVKNRDQDLEITPQMKGIILQSVNYALQNPMTLPEK